MKTFKSYMSVNSFTGICKLSYDNSIRCYKNGVLHQEDSAAVIFGNLDKGWYLNGLMHRESGAALKYSNGDKSFYYKGKFYGTNIQFTNSSWMKKNKEIKRKEAFQIFI